MLEYEQDMLDLRQDLNRLKMEVRNSENGSIMQRIQSRPCNRKFMIWRTNMENISHSEQ